jgi:hypothetical protein
MMDVDLGNAVLYGDGAVYPDKLLRPELLAQVIRPDLVIPIGEVEAYLPLVIGGKSGAG